MSESTLIAKRLVVVVAATLTKINDRIPYGPSGRVRYFVRSPAVYNTYEAQIVLAREFPVDSVKSWLGTVKLCGRPPLQPCRVVAPIHSRVSTVRGYAMVRHRVRGNVEGICGYLVIRDLQ
jgi:hypothetical protein